MKYHDQLKHPLWQKKRLEVMEYYKFTCEECGAKEDTLNVHHPFYKRGAMIWDYEVDELNCLCEKCHKETHAIDEKLRHALSFHDNAIKTRILGYLDGITIPMRETHSKDEYYVAGYIDAYRNNDTFLLNVLSKVMI